MDKTGVIYILTNPSFPEYVKIGYADDIDKRLQRLNRSECIPFAFRVYATYEVNSRLSDLKIHSIIDVKAKLFCPEIAGLFCRIAGLFCHDSRANLSLKPVCFGIAIS